MLRIGSRNVAAIAETLWKRCTARAAGEGWPCAPDGPASSIFCASLAYHPGIIDLNYRLLPDAGAHSRPGWMPWPD